MIATLSSSDADYSEMKTGLAILKINEADLLREAAEIEKALAAKEGEARRVRQQIEILTQQIYPSVGTAKKALGRAKRNNVENVGGGPAGESLPTLIEKLLRESKDGLSLADLIHKVAENGCVSLCKRPRSIVDQAIFRLKKKGRIARNAENLTFFLKDEVV